MNIGIFTDCYLPTKNGVSTVIAQARAELVRRGHRVILFTVAAPGDHQAGDGCGPVYTVSSLPLNRQIELRLGVPRQGRINEAVTREKLDIIHTHTEFSLGRAGQAAARAAHVPSVHTLHTLYPAFRHYLPLGRFLPVRAVDSFVAAFVNQCDAVVCPSEKGRAYVASCAPLTCTTVIPNGVLPERFHPARSNGDLRSEGRAALGIGAGARVVLYAGRLAPEKRVVTLLEVLCPLLAADASARAVFVGAGPQSQTLAAMAGAGEVSPSVLLAGPVAWQDMPRFYALADVFATASLSEIHPMTLIEAASCGLPIVARNDPGTCDLVLDGLNGFLVDSDAEMPGRIATLLQDDAARQAFGRNAARLAGRLTIAAHVDQLEALYRDTIETHLRKAVQ